MLDDHGKKCWNNSVPVHDLRNVATNHNRMKKLLHGQSRKHIGSVPKKIEMGQKQSRCSTQEEVTMLSLLKDVKIYVTWMRYS